MTKLPQPDSRINLDLEIRYERERERMYQASQVTVGTMVFGGIPPRNDKVAVRHWSEGLLAACLFHVAEEYYVDFNQGLLYVITLQRATVSVMLSELLDQVNLVKIFERSEEQSKK